MSYPAHVHTCLLAFLFYGSLFAQSQQNEFDAGQLQEGQIYFKEIVENNIPGIEAVFIIKTARMSLWTAITDYTHYTRYFDNFERIRVIQETREGATVELWAKSFLATMNYTAYRKYEKPFYILKWERISGDFKTNKGSWELSDTADGKSCLVRYRMFIELDGALGKKFNNLVNSESPKRIRKMIANLRKYLE